MAVNAMDKLKMMIMGPASALPEKSKKPKKPLAETKAGSKGKDAKNTPSSNPFKPRC